MTIFGMRYRPAPYVPVTGIRRAWPLARLELGSLFRSKWGVALFFVCAFPSIVRLVLLLAWLGVLGFGGPVARRAGGNAPRALQGLLPENVEFYVEPIVAPEQGLFVLLLLTALCTARAIAKDRATNALEFYWTRGLSPRGYFLAKWAGATLLVALLTVVVPCVLWLCGVLLAEDWSFLANTVGFVPRALLGLGLFTVVLTTLCTLISAAVATANLATILWAVLLVGTKAAAEIVTQFTRDQAASWLSVWDAAATLARAVAGIVQPGASVGGAAVVLLVWLVVVGGLAARRLRVQGAVA